MTIYEGDSTKITLIICALFLFGLYLCGRQIWKITKEISYKNNSLPIEVLKLKYSAPVSIIRYTANSLVFLGLIGTVIGFIISLSGVDPDLVKDVDSIGPMVSTLIQGMSVALYTTLVGAILNLWLTANYRLLLNSTIRLVSTSIESRTNEKLSLIHI